MLDNLVQIPDVAGGFKTDQYVVVGTTLTNRKIVVTSNPLRPTEKRMQGHRKTWPRGVQLYYCDAEGNVELIEG